MRTTLRHRRLPCTSLDPLCTCAYSLSPAWTPLGSLGTTWNCVELLAPDVDLLVLMWTPLLPCGLPCACAYHFGPAQIPLCPCRPPCSHTDSLASAQICLSLLRTPCTHMDLLVSACTPLSPCGAPCTCAYPLCPCRPPGTHAGPFAPAHTSLQLSWLTFEFRVLLGLVYYWLEV